MKDNTITAEKNAEYERIYREKKWLMWLLKVWDDNNKRPTWIMLKRNWPEEYRGIIAEFGSWDQAERKMQDTWETREQITQECELKEMQAVHASSANIIALEKHILGLIKLQGHLGTDRLPTYKEIARYSAKLDIPNPDSYLRTLVSKRNWKPCIQGYLAVTPDNRAEFLRNMGSKLYKQWKTKNHRTEPDLLPRQLFTNERCLEIIREIYEFFGVIPSQREISDYLDQKKGYPSFTTLTKRFGCISKWVPLIVNYRMDQEIDRYLANCGDLKVEGPTNLDSLLRKLEEVTSVNEKIGLKKALQQVRKLTKKTTAKFEVEIGDQEYEVVVRKKEVR